MAEERVAKANAGRTPGPRRCFRVCLMQSLKSTTRPCLANDSRLYSATDHRRVRFECPETSTLWGWRVRQPFELFTGTSPTTPATQNTTCFIWHNITRTKQLPHTLGISETEYAGDTCSPWGWLFLQRKRTTPMA